MVSSMSCLDGQQHVKRFCLSWHVIHMPMTYVMHEMQSMRVYYSHDQNREEHLIPSEHRRFLVVHNGNRIKKKNKSFLR